MRYRLGALALGLVVAAGCQTAVEDVVGDDPVGPDPTPRPGLVLDLEITSELRTGEPAEFVLHLQNNTDEAIEIEMPSGQTGDIVLRRDGEERYRWSEGRAFTMALQFFTLEPGEERTFVLEEEALDVEPGAYELEASSTADPTPDPVHREVTVEG